MKKTNLYLERSFITRKINFYISSLGDSGKMYTAKPVVMKEVEPADYQEPAFSLSEEEAREFFNYLWENGFRPEKYAIPDAAFNAQAEHLDDMRKIAFKFLKMEVK